MSLAIGSTLGSYRIDGLIGYGGMGEVYRASHTAIERTVAIKLLVNLSTERRLIDRFRNEARIHARLSHPGVATLYDFLETAQGPAIVMEFVAGRTIDEEMRRSRRLSWSEAMGVLRDVAEAVAYLHENGIVHRDIKPNNVKITPSGRAKLLDFGIAKDVRSPKLTVAEKIIGTVQYMAPEQLVGRAATPASDVWALGVLFYEMLTGSQPFAENSISGLLKRIGAAEYRPVAEVDPRIPNDCRQIIDRCLQADPAARYPNAGALLAAMRLTWPNQTAGKPRRRAAAPALARLLEPIFAVWRTHRLAAVAGAALAGCLVAALLFLMPGEKSPMPQPAPTAAQQAPVKIGSFTPGTSVEVTAIDGQRKPAPLTGTAPFVFRAPVGATVTFTVRRGGGKPVERTIVVRENSNEYTY